MSKEQTMKEQTDLSLSINLENLEFYKFFGSMQKVSEHVADIVFVPNGEENAIEYSKVAIIKEIIANKEKYGELLDFVDYNPRYYNHKVQDLIFGFEMHNGCRKICSANAIILKLYNSLGNGDEYVDLLEKGNKYYNQQKETNND